MVESVIDFLNIGLVESEIFQENFNKHKNVEGFDKLFSYLNTSLVSRSETQVVNYIFDNKSIIDKFR